MAADGKAKQGICHNCNHDGKPAADGNSLPQ